MGFPHLRTPSCTDTQTILRVLRTLTSLGLEVVLVERQAVCKPRQYQSRRRSLIGNSEIIISPLGSQY
jgi:hypothetical protein